MQHRQFLSSSSSLVSSLATLGSASAGACAGGVCTVAAQAGSTILAAGASSTAGVLGTTQAFIPFWQQTPSVSHATGLPWWMKLLIIALLLSTGFTVYQLHGKPKMAFLAGAAGMAAACAELRWFPGGMVALYPVLAFALPALVLSPWIPRIRWNPAVAKITKIAFLSIASLALLFVFGLQIFGHWQPCILCWAQRGSLTLFIAFLGWQLRYPSRAMLLPLLSLSALLGGVFAFAQFLEMHQVPMMSTAADVCVRLGAVSCAAAGAHPMLGYPIAIWSLAFFACLWVVSLLLLPSRQS